MLANGSEAGASLTSPDAATPPTPAADAVELARVKQELQQCQEKFASWRERAKAGVDSMRVQIIDLTQRLNQAEKQHTASAAETATLANTESRSLASAMETSLMQKMDLASAHTLAVACLFVGSLRTRNADTAAVAAEQREGRPSTVSSTVTPTCAAAQLQPQQLEKLKRTVQDQADRLKEVHYALQRATNELKQRSDVLQRQDEAMAVLRRRAETLEATNAALEEQLMNVPNADEWRLAQEELDHQLESCRLEYESRESHLVLQHSNEMQQLNVAHEEDLREVQRDAQERIAQAVQNTLASQAHGSAAVDAATPTSKPSTQPMEDASYMDLLDEYKALEASAAAAMRERDATLLQQKALARELQDLFRAVGNGGMNDAPPTSSLRGVALPASLTNETPTLPGTDDQQMEEVIRQVGELRVRVLAVQEELSKCRREAVQLKRSKSAVPAEGLGAQQTQYLRSVVVQLLCSLNDVIVAKRLLPVLSVLLKFSDEDTTAVAKAMPHWTHRR